VQATPNSWYDQLFARDSAALRSPGLGEKINSATAWAGQIFGGQPSNRRLEHVCQLFGKVNIGSLPKHAQKLFTFKTFTQKLWRSVGIY
jgi:hypothetical protein